MVNVFPFLGLRFNKDKVGRIDDVIALPYDQIKEPERKAFYERHANNICRIIKGEELEGDNESFNVYTRAKDYLEKWIMEDVMIQDEKPAIYAYHQEFNLPTGEFRCRKGIIAMVELEKFGEGKVKPHEKTLDKPKTDRLNLLKHTDCHFGQIFQLYEDAELRINKIMEPFTQGEPLVEGTLGDGTVHKVWACTDEAAIEEIRNALEFKDLFIADGHHRYETACNFMDFCAERYEFPRNSHAPRNAMMTLVSMDDPGLNILPTHRLVHSLPDFDKEKFLEALKGDFDVSEIKGKYMMDQLKREHKVPGLYTFGIYFGDGPLMYHVKLRRFQSMEEYLKGSRSEDWMKLDVSILHTLILDKVLGIDDAKLAAQSNVSYIRDHRAGAQEVLQGRAQMLVVMNPTKLEQVKKVAAAGEVMPQKSTDFYPKLLTGLVNCRVDRGEPK
jgi:uncharacterized protein (DUF1015 family)